MVAEYVLAETTEENVLCSILGLQDDIACRLRNLSEEMRRHRVDKYFILCFIEQRDESENVEDLRDTKTLKCALQKMGFTKYRSNVVANWIAKQPFPEHISLLAWAKIYIEGLFKYDIRLNHKVPKFPFRESDLNKWFTVSVDNERDDASFVPVLNTTTKDEAVTQINDLTSQVKSKDPKGQLFFHGTDHVSAKNILDDGIKLGCGKVRCDFSNGKGFYLVNDFEYALNWAQKDKAAAVILFKITHDHLNGVQGLDLSGSERHKDLEAIIKFFRSGEQHRNKLSEKLKHEVKSCDYIVGPISRDNVKDVQQICIRKEEMAGSIGDMLFIEGVVFLNDLEDI
ncbi:uncharacterized protein LOC114532557 [Dendronephthya gigantea]|uniref:uncharacterized protein LOC114532557 n=1 Tax=Dendronephthya gigantea TaxID=151771 RepID=UPI00106D2D66|nr:uncharacterized protein LOC114532557 [Dendronephthya gigantea]